MTHSRLSPSKAPRWVRCPGSVALVGDAEDTGSIYAEEGTKAHDVAAHRLMQKPGPAAADIETSDYINVYVDAVSRAAEGKILLVEKSFDISRWTTEPGGKGSSDAIIVDLDTMEIEVWDLKFGQGHMVHAEGNYQLMLYALGALSLVEPLYGQMKTIKLVICQPRRDHLSEVVMLRDELRGYGLHFAGQGNIALSCKAGTMLCPSDEACLWCPVKATCPALAAKVHSEVFSDFETATFDSPNLKLPGESYALPETLDLIETWIKAQYAYAGERLNAGIPTPGWKLVAGRRGSRTWRNEAEVESILKRMRFKKSQTHTEEMIPLTQIEKLVGKEKWKEFFAPLTTQADGKPTLVSERDPRAPYEAGKKEDFLDTSAFV